MVELVDTQDLKSCDLNSRTGSSPVPGTKREFILAFFVMEYWNGSYSEGEYCFYEIAKKGTYQDLIPSM